MSWKILLSTLFIAGVLSIPGALYANEGDPFGGDDMSFSIDKSETGAFSDSTENDDFGSAFAEATENTPTLTWSGFVEVEQGGHIGAEGIQDKDWVMSNRRARLATSMNSEIGRFYLKADFIEDSITNQTEVELREARVQATPFSWMDISAGKQVVTWGVGDMLFINDLFPKNWVSNFLGRDMESMKDSANAARVTSYFGNITFDIVYHPEFAPDTTPTGCRFAIYDPNSKGLTTNTDSCSSGSVNHRDTEQYKNSELAVSLNMKVGNQTLALYGYRGYFKNPKGLQWMDASGDVTGSTDITQSAMLSGSYTTMTSYYPKLEVLGFSAEGQLGPGIYSLEAGYYDSKEDEDGDNIMIENSLLKSLFGYKMDFNANLSAGVQWYQEIMQDYDKYEESVQTYMPQLYDYRKKETQHTFTLRLTVKAQQETLWINLFHYERPEDKDRFTKLDLTKRLDNKTEVVLGMNLFDGEENYLDREFGMLKDDDNAFIRIKYNF